MKHQPMPTQRIAIRLSSRLRTAIDAAAARDEKTTSELIRSILAGALGVPDDPLLQGAAAAPARERHERARSAANARWKSAV